MTYKQERKEGDQKEGDDYERKPRPFKNDGLKTEGKPRQTENNSFKKAEDDEFQLVCNKDRN